MDTCKLLRAAAACTALVTGASSPLRAQQAEDALEAEDAPRVAQSCLSHSDIRRTRVLDDSNIVFVTRDNTIYDNRLLRECPSLRRGSKLNYPIENGRLCAGYNVQLLWETSPGRYVPAFACQLGYFVPITEGELEDLEAATDESRDRRPRRRSSREAVSSRQVELPPADPAPAIPETE